MADGWRLLYVRALAIVVILLISGPASFAYSVLTHEEIVDLLWTNEIQPLLLRRYPGLLEDQIKSCLLYTSPSPRD